MAEAGSVLPEATLAELNEFSKGVWEAYIGSRTPEQYAADSEKTKKFLTDEEFKAEKMAEMQKAFTDADANSDGLLDEAEFLNWAQALKDLAKGRGDYTDEREGVDKKWYDFSNAVTPDTNGASMQDFFVVMGAAMKVQLALKAEYDAAKQ